jgi:hypothetical protein
LSVDGIAVLEVKFIAPAISARSALPLPAWLPALEESTGTFSAILKSKRSVSLNVAKEISKAAREHGAEPVGVFVEEDAKEIEQACDATNIALYSYMEIVHAVLSKSAYKVEVVKNLTGRILLLHQNEMHIGTYELGSGYRMACIGTLAVKQSVGDFYLHCLRQPRPASQYKDLCSAASLLVCV